MWRPRSQWSSVSHRYSATSATLNTAIAVLRDGTPRPTIEIAAFLQTFEHKTTLGVRRKNYSELSFHEGDSHE